LLIFSITIIFSLINHPLSIGLIILIQTFLISLRIGILYGRFIFSYILFLVFVGGLIILFIYFASLVSNEIFKFSYYSLLWISFIFLFLSVIFTFIIDYYFLDSVSSSCMEDVLFTNFIKLILKENVLSLIKLYIYPRSFLNMLLISYLLFTLIVVVKVTRYSTGPLRRGHN